MSASTLFDDCGSVYEVRRPRRFYSFRSKPEVDANLILGRAGEAIRNDSTVDSIGAQHQERRRKQLMHAAKNPEDINNINEAEESESCAYQLDQWLKKVKCTGVTGRKLEHFQEIKVGILDEPVDPDSPSIEPFPNLDEEEYEYSGGKFQGEYHGKAVVEFANGDVIAGPFRNGLRHGEFRVSCSKNGINAIYGEYVDDELHGKVKVIYENGDWLEGYFKQGILHGFGRYFDRQGRLRIVANHKDGILHGTCWKIIRGGGCLVGRVNSDGKFSGIRMAYIYPDFQTALVGCFEDGLMKAAQACRLKTVVEDRGIKVPIFTEPHGPFYKRELATFDAVTIHPLLRDPYESRMVMVGQSKVEGANDGLFAAINIEPNTVIAFYNGIRIKPRSKDDCDHEDWEKNAYKIFDPSRKNGTIDIPVEFRSCDNYVATLAHKTNHSFLPNAEFVSYDHPKYGLVPCLVSNHDIKKGEEIFVHYGYYLDGCPEWYEAAWLSGNYPVPDSLKEEDRSWEESDYQDKNRP